MQRHFSNRGEALAESAAAKVKTHRSPSSKTAPAGRSGRRVLPEPWQQKAPKATNPVVAGNKKKAGRAAFVEIEHPAGRAFQVQGRTMAELLEKAAHAVVALDGVPPGSEWFVRRTVEVDGPDRETLLVNWLNEILDLEQTHHEFYDQFVIKDVGDNHVWAQVYGRKSEDRITALKAVPFHNVKLKRAPKGLEATIIVDV
jgi:protein archease